MAAAATEALPTSLTQQDGVPGLAGLAGLSAGILAGIRQHWLVLALSSAAVIWHAVMLVAHSHGIGFSAVLIAMTLWCAGCTVELVARPSVHCLRRLAVMSALMILVHAVMVAGFPGVGSGHQHHGGSATTSTVTTGNSTLLMLGIMVLELMVALSAGWMISHTKPVVAAASRG